MDKIIVLKELTGWAVINIIAPLVIPLLFALCLSTFYIRVEMTVQELFMLLLKNGVYTFLGMTVLIGLFQDYRKIPYAFTLDLSQWILVLASLRFALNDEVKRSSSLSSSQDLSLLAHSDPSPMNTSQENIGQFIVTTVGSFQLAIYYKIKILKTMSLL